MNVPRKRFVIHETSKDERTLSKNMTKKLRLRYLAFNDEGADARG